MTRPVSPPQCTRIGIQCRSLKVVLRVADAEDGLGATDHEVTWLLGHTERISFGDLWEDDGDLYSEAVIHVPCKHLQLGTAGTSCRAHGFQSTTTPRDRPRPTQPRQLGHDRFLVAESAKLKSRTLPFPPTPKSKSALPVLEDNPCATAKCQTADHSQHAACCRDLQIEVMCTRSEARLESLLRARKSPYLCKTERSGDDSLEVEVISACGYLEEGGVNCTLHGRLRKDGRPAKPELCSHWPPKRQTLHPGCAFAPKRRRR